MDAYRKTDEALAALTPEQFRVTQKNGTERPGTGALLGNTRTGDGRRTLLKARVQSFAAGMQRFFQRRSVWM